MPSPNAIPTGFPEFVQALIDPQETLVVVTGGDSIQEMVVPKGASQKTHILFLYDDKTAAKSEWEYSVAIGENADVKLTESHIALDGAEFSSQAKVNIVVKAGARLELQRLNAVGDGGTFKNYANIQAHKDAQVTVTQLTLGGRSVRNELNAELLEPGATAQLLGLSVAKGKQQVDNTTFVHHKVGHTNSNQIFKNLLAGESRIGFTGRLIIAEDAQKSDAAQLNQNLVLGDRAEVNTTPQLEVFADDVKAAHGASVGQLDNDQIFYLMSRGISKAEATHMLADGFLQDIVHRMPTSQQKKGRALLATAFHDFVEAEL